MAPVLVLLIAGMLGAVVAQGATMLKKKGDLVTPVSQAVKLAKSPPGLGGGGGSYQPVRPLTSAPSFLGGILGPVIGATSGATAAISAAGVSYGGNPTAAAGIGPAYLGQVLPSSNPGAPGAAPPTLIGAGGIAPPPGGGAGLFVP